ncbi:MAG: uracil phosphoribosyltransferase [Candidatus Cyclobacteriaceae bacterium M3_2C_046]
MVYELSQENSLVHHFITELRDQNIQKDSMKFRKNLERLGEILAYELSKTLNYTSHQVNTSLGIKTGKLLVQQPVLLTILRAGIPFFQGVLNFFDQAECGFIGAFRQDDIQHHADIKINLSYAKFPKIGDKVIILADPMLATGQSLVATTKEILKTGQPRHIHFLSVLASPEGIDHLSRHISLPYSIWTISIDDKLDQKGYIIPGLGDAGDLAFGRKQ